MKVITATMAKNIANDFMNNACGQFVKEMMDLVLLEANKGRHSCYHFYPGTWDSLTKKNIEMFFCNLGYTTENTTSTLTLKW
jgi:hypothetical protein